MFKFLLSETSRFCFAPDEPPAGGGGADPAPAPAGNTPAAPTTILSDPPPAADPAQPPVDPAAPKDPADPAADPAKPADKDESGLWGDEKWRERYAGDDQAKKNVLARYNSPTALIDAHFALLNKMKAGDLKAKLPDNPTEEQLASFRKDNGIPDTHDGYLEKLEGVTLGEEDKAAMQPFLTEMHKLNAPPSIVNAVLKQYFDLQEQQVAAVSAKDVEVRDQGITALKSEWGPEYQKNINMVTSLIERFPEEVRPLLMGARLSDPSGTPLLSSPAILKTLADIANDVTPTPDVMAMSGAENIASIDAKLAEYHKMMTTKAWYSNQAAQDDYQRLVRLKEKLDARKV